MSYIGSLRCSGNPSLSFVCNERWCPKPPVRRHGYGECDMMIRSNKGDNSLNTMMEAWLYTGLFQLHPLHGINEGHGFPWPSCLPPTDEDH
jgi:hypothetical protein